MAVVVPEARLVVVPEVEIMVVAPREVPELRVQEVREVVRVMEVLGLRVVLDLREPISQQISQVELYWVAAAAVVLRAPVVVAVVLMVVLTAATAGPEVLAAPAEMEAVLLSFTQIAQFLIREQ